MNFKTSIRVLFLLAITIPSALISHPAGAVQSSDRQLEDLEFSANTINKVRELIPQTNLTAKKSKDLFNQPVNVGGMQCTADIINGEITNLNCPPLNLPTPNPIFPNPKPSPAPSPGGPFAQMGNPTIKSNSKSFNLKLKDTPSAADVLRSLSSKQVG
ncbi:hypothetical protein [Merismopedia glauca]|uniref:Uncharacterized protein n=1 Tax=Merismopedia glauca CCAP 1448/3 TaxID=1296344 RepID=A0A2T1C2F9_9CYAN|nr:hypothetical protein [Merismopedia glauca]PSB02460.1 hypothetical protein C7B64_13005 [Merismopedia glauca CCAP 1448/3]